MNTVQSYERRSKVARESRFLYSASMGLGKGTGPGRPSRQDREARDAATQSLTIPIANEPFDETADISLPPKPLAEGLKIKGVPKMIAAAIIGITDGYVGQQVDKGRILATTEGLIPFDEVRRIIQERTRRQASQGNPAGSTDPGNDHDARLKKAKADTAELELEQLRGTLVSRAAVEALYKDIAMVVKRRVLPLADSMAPILQGMPVIEIRKRLTTKLNEALAYLSRDLKVGKGKKAVEEDDE